MNSNTAFKSCLIFALVLVAFSSVSQPQTFGGPVGIGTATPQTTLTVGDINSGSGEATYRGSIQIQSPGGTINSTGGLEFKAASSVGGWGWRMTSPDYGSANTPLVFQYRARSSTWTEAVRIKNNGYFGIGTTDPANKLEVQGGGIYASDYMSTPGRMFGNGFLLPLSNFGADGLYYENDNNTLMMKLKTNSYPIDIASNGTGRFIKFSTNGNEERMRVDAYGNVNMNNRLTVGDRIGTNKVLIGLAIDDPKANNYALAVNGAAIANKIIVKSYSNWPDYVFEPTYKLPSLVSLDAFIAEFKHLPDVPSAKEIEADGLDIGSTQTILLKKIEELTLYVIKQSKELQEQQMQINKLKKHVR